MSNVASFIKKLKQSESFQNFKKEMLEMSVTGGVDGYQTPNAFAPSEEAFDETSKENAEQFGYKVAPKQKRKHSITYKQYATQESVYKQAMAALHEGSYKSYKTDETRSVNQKINHSIKEINRAIYEIERVVGHASRLKLEMGVDQRTLWSSSHKRLHKIGERLNRISKRINELGA